MQKDDVTLLRPHWASDDVSQTTFNGRSVPGGFHVATLTDPLWHGNNELYKWGKQHRLNISSKEFMGLEMDTK